MGFFSKNRVYLGLGLLPSLSTTQGCSLTVVIQMVIGVLVQIQFVLQLLSVHLRYSYALFEDRDHEHFVIRQCPVVQTS